MPMRVRYTVFDGEVVSENRGGTERDYVPDPLGSTVELLDSTQTKTDGWTYWPYGEVKTRTGTNATPFQYVGTYGYYQDSSSRNYVRARELDVAKGRWLTEDPIGFDDADWNLYGYCRDNPTTKTDPSGNQARTGGKPKRPPRPPYPTYYDRCLDMSPGACFTCVVQMLRNPPVSPYYPGYGPPRLIADPITDPQMLCMTANLMCGSNINCGTSSAPGPGIDLCKRIPDPDPGMGNLPPGVPPPGPSEPGDSFDPIFLGGELNPPGSWRPPTKYLDCRDGCIAACLGNYNKKLCRDVCLSICSQAKRMTCTRLARVCTGWERNALRPCR